jgi:glycosyltransferase involved in cell wall biosynthesis
MLKILHIIPDLKKGGAERLVVDICNELSLRPAVAVKIVIFKDCNEYSYATSLLDINIIPSMVIPSITNKPIIKIDELMQFIDHYKPDIIHSHLFEAEIVSRFKLCNGVKYFTHCHDNMPQFNPFSIQTVISKKKCTLFYEKMLLVRNYRISKTTFIAISNHTVTFFQNSLSHRLKGNIRLLYNAINFNRFYSNKKDQKDLSTLKLISIGSFVPKKNQQLLLSVVALLKKRGFTVALTLLGNGSEFDNLKNSSKRLGIEAFIKMPGNVDSVEQYLLQNDIYVHSAYYEPFGLVLLEAMAAGLPVVCLDGGGNKDIMVEGKNGYIIDEQNAALFADKIIALYTNRILYNEMSTFAQQYAQQYDIKNYVDRLLELYTLAPPCSLK